jgi:pyruvate/2-oxoglutarate dehydrogenase complex dihydrolipoamide dehydrogenase (E3) component
VVRRRGLARLRIKGRAVALHAGRSSIEAELEDGERIAARHILLALGLGEQPRWPQWALELRRKGAMVSHLSDPAHEGVGPQNRIAVIGAGSSGVQLALALAGTHAGRVTLLSPHPLRVSNYDFDPCWIGPKCMRSFSRLDWSCRRQVVDQNRFPGTIPEDVAQHLETALKAGRLDMLIDRIRRVTFRAGGIEMTMASGTFSRFDEVVLATGFQGVRPGGRFIDRAVEAFKLNCAPCGYPILDEYLRWHERLFVTGPLAELQIGPCSRNIIGARNAGRRLEAFFSRSTHSAG